MFAARRGRHRPSGWSWRRRAVAAGRAGSDPEPTPVRGPRLFDLRQVRRR